MTSRSGLLIPALRELGIADLTQYGIYEFSKRSGLLRRRAKLYGWNDRPLEFWLRDGISLDGVLASERSFFFEYDESMREALREFPADDLRREADEILDGKFRVFGGPPVSLGTPPDWGLIPLADGQATVPLDRHWTEYETEGSIDLRLLWEPARLGWAFTLSRAYLVTGEERYAAGVLGLISSWLENNLPNRGPHWISGQETALRNLALIFVWHALAGYWVTSRAEAVELLVAIAVHAERIPPTISYARAQRNNHLLSEAVGLYSVGLLMPWFEQASEWKRLGRKWLIQAVEDQVFEDGGYIQYSTNYQRLALSVGLWAARLSEIHAEPLPQSTLEALWKMTEFLLSVTDASGLSLNWGHNDGSNVLPLSTSEQSDYRPVLQAASRAFRGAPAFDRGPWDEMSVWLGVQMGNGEPEAHSVAADLSIAPARLRKTTSPPASLAPKTAADFPQAGLYLIGDDTSSAVVRCARFVARPAHSDQLHMDLRWNGQNIARDAGTYRYSAAPPWENAFAGARAHNTLMADDREPMDRAGRFLWLNWSQGRFLGRWEAEDGSVQALAAEHSLRNGIKHRRSVVHAGGSMWVVLDELIGTGDILEQHTARLAWHLIDWPWELDGQTLILSGENGQVQLRLTPSMDQINLYRAGERVGGENQNAEDPVVQGWWSPTYGYKQPALTLVATVEGRLPLRLTSWWRLGDVEPKDLLLEWDNIKEDPLMAFLSSG